jgi:queuine tRNA-ribosyltransferase
MLLTWHNLTYYQDLMQSARAAIFAGRLSQFTADARLGWIEGDKENA